MLRRDGTGQQRADALETLKSKALAIGANPHIYNEDWSYRQESGRLVYEDENGLCDLSLPRLPGNHQIDNAALAVATVKAAGLAPAEDAISSGIEGAQWPARMQRLTKGPLVEMIMKHEGDTGEVWLDGGHNPHAAQALARTLADLEERSPKPVILICGMQANKDAHGFFHAFEDLVSTVFTVEAPTGKPYPAAELARIAQEAGVPAEPMASVTAALEQAMKDTGRSGEGMPRVLVCGSLYLAGHILEDHA